MSASIPSCRSPAAVTAYVLFLLLKAQADQYYIPGTSLETSKWSDKFTVGDVSSFYFNVPDPAIEVLSPKGFRVTYIGKPYYKSVTFSGFINKVFLPLEQDEVIPNGEIVWDILPDKDMRHVQESRDYNLQAGDFLNYWTKVTLTDGRIFFKLNNTYTIGR